MVPMETSELQQRTEDAANYLRHQVQDAPYRTLGAVALAGYVLGGGLTPALVRLIALNAGRAMAGNLFAAALRGVTNQRSQS
jgi:hypothetical protein